MSASFLHEPVDPNRARPLNAGVSRDADIIEEVFGPLPFVFTDALVPQLQAMAAVRRGHVGHHTANLWQNIIDAIETNGAIKVWVEY